MKPVSCMISALLLFALFSFPAHFRQCYNIEVAGLKLVQQIVLVPEFPFGVLFVPRSMPFVPDPYFFHDGNLNRHVKIVHLGVKPYNCTVCDRAFGKSDHLKRHMKSHNRTGGPSGGVATEADDDHIPVVDAAATLPSQPPMAPMLAQAE